MLHGRLCEEFAVFFCLWGRRFCSHMGVTFSKRHVLYAFSKAPATQNPIVNARESRVERDVLKTASRRLLRGCALKGRVERDVLETASRRLLHGCALKGRVERDVLETASRRLLRACALKDRVERDVLKTSPPCAALLTFYTHSAKRQRKKKSPHTTCWCAGIFGRCVFARKLTSRTCACAVRWGRRCGGGKKRGEVN